MPLRKTMIKHQSSPHALEEPRCHPKRMENSRSSVLGASNPVFSPERRTAITAVVKAQSYQMGWGECKFPAKRPLCPADLAPFHPPAQPVFKIRAYTHFVLPSGGPRNAQNRVLRPPTPYIPHQPGLLIRSLAREMAAFGNSRMVPKSPQNIPGVNYGPKSPSIPPNEAQIQGLWASNCCFVSLTRTCRYQRSALRSPHCALMDEEHRLNSQNGAIEIPLELFLSILWRN